MEKKYGMGKAYLAPLNSDSEVRGVVHFIPEGRKKMRVEAHVKGLKPNSLQGFHVHEFGDCSDAEGMKAGGHFDPTGHKPHGGPHSAKRHLGDLGNLESDALGQAAYRQVFSGMNLFGWRGVLGRSVVVHIDPDDLESQPAGASGDRVACAVIGYVRQQEKEKDTLDE